MIFYVIAIVSILLIVFFAVRYMYLLATNKQDTKKVLFTTVAAIGILLVIFCINAHVYIKKCPDCGFTYNVAETDYTFCPECNYKLKNVCNNCYELLPEDTTLCPNCGYDNTIKLVKTCKGCLNEFTFKIDEETDYCTDCQSKLILCGNCNERAIFIENKCSNCGAVVTD